MDRSPWHVDLLMVILVLMWGTAFSAIKALGEVLDPYQLTWFRYAPFLFLYGGWLLLRRRKELASLTGREWVTMGVLGFLAVIGYHFPLNWGLDSEASVQVTGATGAILVSTVPLWVLLIAAVVGQEHFTLRRAIGSAVAFAGVLVVILLGRGEVDVTFAKRAAVIILAPLAWGIYSVWAKPVVGKHGGLFTTGLTMCLGSLMLLPIARRTGVEPLLSFDATLWAWLVFLSIFSTVLGYAIWNHGLQYKAASQVAVYVYLIPVVATLAGWVLLREPVTIWFVLGAALVLAGVILVNRSRIRAPGAPPRPSDA